MIYVINRDRVFTLSLFIGGNTLDKFVIKGGTRLKGDVTISGAKNAAVAIIPACLLIEDKCRLENLPDIKDVKLYLDILRDLGADINEIEIFSNLYFSINSLVE